MVGVVFVFVREDAGDVEALAEAFDAEGYGIDGRADAADALHVIVWSRAARRSQAFVAAVERAAHAERRIVVCLTPPPGDAFSAPVVDLSDWDGVDSAALDPLFAMVSDILRPALPHVIALPARPDFEDAEFTKAPRAAIERDKRVRVSWETPIPTHALRPVQEPPPEPKLGASAPRRDFRKIRRKPDHARAHAALMFAVVTLTAGSLLITTVQSFAAKPQRVEAAETGGVSLSSASNAAIGLEDVAPEERAPPLASHRGLEPPSARTVRNARYEP